MCRQRSCGRTEEGARTFAGNKEKWYNDHEQGISKSSRSLANVADLLADPRHALSVHIGVPAPSVPVTGVSLPKGNAPIWTLSVILIFPCSAIQANAPLPATKSPSVIEGISSRTLSGTNPDCLYAL